MGCLADSNPAALDHQVNGAIVFSNANISQRKSFPFLSANLEQRCLSRGQHLDLEAHPFHGGQVHLQSDARPVDRLPPIPGVRCSSTPPACEDRSPPIPLASVT